MYEGVFFLLSLLHDTSEIRERGGEGLLSIWEELIEKLIEGMSLASIKRKRTPKY